ncbi:MAG: hypothetical protein ACR2JC_14400 [Chloroflexota bacterium]|nr:MAG: hypothetical protein DLM70_07470 [Chloroflexota bacterium]
MTLGFPEGKRRGAGAHEPSGRPVRLARGLAGYYRSFTRGASCRDSSTTWDYRSYRYTLGLKAIVRSGMIKVVNSAISSGPV